MLKIVGTDSHELYIVNVIIIVNNKVSSDRESSRQKFYVLRWRGLQVC